MVFNESSKRENFLHFYRLRANAANMKEEKVEGGGGVCAVCGDKATGIHYRVLSCEVRGGEGRLHFMIIFIN